MTQIDLAKILKSSQSRVAKMEAPSPTASLDQLFKAFFLVGGEFSVIESHQRQMRSKVKSDPQTQFRHEYAAVKLFQNRGIHSGCEEQKRLPVILEAFFVAAGAESANEQVRFLHKG